MTETVEAAGGVVCRKALGDELEIIVVHRPKYDDWSLPKGKTEPGESAADCALREVEEETGIKCKLGRELSPVEYRDRNGRRKTVRYWKMIPKNGKTTFEANSEVDEARWVGVEEARRLLTYDRDRAVVDSLLLDMDAPVLLLRHCAAGDRADFSGPDRERPLTKKGRAQADALVETFRRFDVGRIISSPYLRCIQSVEPLAARLGLSIEIREELAEGSNEAASLVMEASGERAAVLSTHGDIVFDLLGGRDSSKAGTWVLEAGSTSGIEVRGARGWRATDYLPPPEIRNGD